MDKLKEVTKNFFVCAILCIVAGVGLLVMSKMVMGVFTVVAGVAFLIIGIVMAIKDIKSGDTEQK